MKKLFVFLAVVIFFFIITYLTWPTEKHPSLTHDVHHGVVSQIYEQSSERGADAHEYPSSTAHLGDLDTLGVHALGKHFFIPKRQQDLLHYPCSNCHNEALESLKSKEQKLGQKAHWDIQLKHASSDVMTCTTCHSETNMDDLHSITNKKILFNNSFKVCAQCHQEEYKDWAGGAHGKRIGGWTKPIVKKTCVNCHNPHRPAFEKRLPARYNTKMIEQRKQ
ncbi:cytochrome c3 family protein [Aureispira anguillae]|uniref:Doubled CXXCH motif domain-containing protein n=1 Tax=Aureispira anguillae TaxID=2864201 RepID=A0A915YKM6_9BACT|nr:cytochrome c3 family protein [Aureispira anguillae]BDS14764.1 hypothetical protein AsAng_0055460 [Aureispira anguillae]